MNSERHPSSGATSRLQPLRPGELASPGEPRLSWLWDGYLAPGKITAAQQGLICCSGSGYRGDPFLYWLPGREPWFWPGDSASEEEKQAWRDRWAEHYRRVRQQPAAT